MRRPDSYRVHLRISLKEAVKMQELIELCLPQIFIIFTKKHHGSNHYIKRRNE